MRTLIIPDVHEQYNDLLKLEDRMEEADRVVMLGDFWDTFQPEGQQGLITTWLLEKLWDPKYTVLWGNHDCHYAFDRSEFLCTGYNPETKRLLRKEMSEDVWRRFKIFTQVGPYMVSHAGLNSKTLYLVEKEKEALEKAFAGGFHPMWQAGRASGGYAEFGGPTWLRWWELEDVGIPQIVGHTKVKKPTQDTLGNWNLDTALRYIAWVEEETGILTTEEV